METPTPPAPLTILVVEDNPEDLYIMHWVLKSHNFAYDLQVIDNGSGMDSAGIDDAMTYAKKREYMGRDLGHFGIGLKAVGAEHFLLATDLGQTGNPSPPDGYKLLVGGLLAEGITKEQIRVMGREVPGRLLMG